MGGNLQAERDQAYHEVYVEGGQDSNLMKVKGRSGLITLSPRKVAEMSPERTAEIQRKESEIN